MSGGEYAPKDSRDVTLRKSEPGKSTGWHDRGPDGDAPEDKLAPDDMRNVTNAAPAGTAPGADSGWRDTEGQGKPGNYPPPVNDAASAGTKGKGAALPEGVPQPAAPFSAEEAAADAAVERSHQE